MTHLLAADGVRFGHRLDLRLLVLLVPVIMAVMFLADFRGQTTPPDVNVFFDPPDPVAEAQMREQQLAEWHQGLVAIVPTYAFPASLLKVASNIWPLVLLAIYLSTALVAGEFEWGTMRTVHLTSSRGRTLGVRVVFIAGPMGVAVVVALVLGAVMPFFLSVEGASLQAFARPVSDLAPQVAARMAVILPFIGIPVLMAILSRSTGLAFVLTLLFFFADLMVTALPLWRDSLLGWLPSMTVTGSISRVMGAGDPSMPGLVPAWVSFVAMIGWAAAAVVLAIARLQHTDLND